MFLVLIEYIEDEGKEWSVVTHGEKGLRSIFPTRKAAEEVAMAKAKDRPNRFSVVEIRSWYQQEPREVKVGEIHLVCDNG